MLQTHTKLTTQGQVSVPAAIRQLLGLTPGAMLQWTQVGEQVVVSRAIRHNSQEVHQALFPQKPARTQTAKPGTTLAELKDGIRNNMLRRHARG